MRNQKLSVLVSVIQFGRCVCLCLLLGLAGCKANFAPVDDLNRPPPKLSGTHTVKPDETLYSISWRYNRDFKELAEVNHISAPYHISPGQVLSLAPAKTPVVAAAPEETKTIRPKTNMQGQHKKSSTTKNVAPQQQQSTVTPAFAQKVTWRWPADGKMQGDFKQTKGINIIGKKGSPIKAAAAGRVVYSGSGLRGYGKLLIVKHNERLLSAYAHNDALFVKEGDWVDIGQKIASMGQSDSKTVQLHFEIRQDGKPVDPLKYLPRK